MKTKFFINRLVLPVFVAALAFAVGSCSKEDLRDSDSHMSERSNLEQAYLDDMAALNNAGGKGSGRAAQNQLLAQIRRATAKYHDFAAAEADGYILDPHCVAVEGLGGMGFHALNPGYFGVDFDPLKPQVLVYEPQEDGTLNLVAVEYIVAAHEPLEGEIPFPFSTFITEFWDDHNDGPPMIGDQEFDDHRLGGGGPPFPHYQLHVWVWKPNPMGMYFPFNPNVSCDFAYLFTD